MREGHHALSHHKKNPEKMQQVSAIDRFYIKQLRYVIESLKAVKEGDSTLLDNMMLVSGCGISDGNRHRHENLPILVAGKGGGVFTPGRHVQYAQNTPMCNLFLSMLDGMGVKEERFGDSTGRLRKLS